MSSGSSFLLFRKHNLTISDDALEAIKQHYKKEAAEGLVNDKSLPLIASLKPFVCDSHYDEATKSWIQHPYDMEKIERDYRYVSIADHKFCDLLLTWDFGSGFDCLKNEWNLSPYKYECSQYMIGKLEADRMLQAVKYLLSGDWSDKMDQVLNNPYIKVFSDGYTGSMYSRYIDRNKPNRFAKILRHAQNGVELTVKIPQVSGIDDDYDERELDEENDQVEFWLRQTEYALEAFLKSEDYSYDNNSELVLLYEAT